MIGDIPPLLVLAPCCPRGHVQSGHPVIPLLEPTRNDKTLPKFSNYADLWEKGDIHSPLRSSKGILKVARELGLGTSTVQRIARVCSDTSPSRTRTAVSTPFTSIRG